jgi:hypothetical protein
MQCGWNEFSNTPSFFARQRSWIDHLLHSCLRSSLDEECLLALGEPAALSLSVAYNARRLNKLASTATKIHSFSDTTRLTLSIANLIRLGRPKADQLRTYAYCTRSYVMGHSICLRIFLANGWRKISRTWYGRATASPVKAVCPPPSRYF